LTAPSIICLSPQEWHVDLPTNRQQIMTRIRRLGHPVVFVETGPWIVRYARRFVRGPERRSLLRQLLSGDQVDSGVRVLKAPTILPWGHKYRSAARVNARITAWVLRRHARNLPSPVVLWLYDPCFADCIGRCGERFAVYDCVDDYAEQTGGDPRKRNLVAMYDALAASRSRIVFATATTLLERHLAHNPRTHLVRNVGDFHHFAKAASRGVAARDVAALKAPVIGFAGNLVSSKVDFDLLEDLAKRRTAWSILLVGPTRADAEQRLARLRNYPNVRHVPAQPYAVLPSYVAAFDVATIPYVENAYTRSCFPLKTFEYLAAGKPVVASGLPELAGLGDHVTLASGAEQFIAAVERGLERTSPADVASRQRVAAQNTWEARTDKLLELLATELEP
jgi:glycosyltransferase involved in cell wall biosynthesis